MLAPSALRSSTKGAPGLLLAALFLAVRLLASSVAMAMPGSGSGPSAIVGAIVFCHAGLDGDAPRAPAHDHSCLTCPACHVGTHVGLPAFGQDALPIGNGGEIGRSAVPPPSTGPPRRPRVAAHPTGPPTASI